MDAGTAYIHWCAQDEGREPSRTYRVRLEPPRA